MSERVVFKKNREYDADEELIVVNDNVAAHILGAVDRGG